MSAGDSATTTTAPAQTTAAGSIMLPVPRMAAASELNSHTEMAPANRRFEYVRAASSAAPLPPSAR
jgi:hypothetical protein